MISSLCFLPRAYVKAHPIPYELSAAERAKLEQAATATNTQGSTTDDNDNDDDAATAHPTTDELSLDQLADLSLNDTQMLNNDGQENSDDDDLGSDMEDTEIKPSDRLLATTSIDDEEVASLEIHVYDPINASLFVHHDIVLPAYPLCVQWIGGSPPGWSSVGSSSFLAVGTFDPNIEIWTTDVLDALEPNAILRGHEDAVLCMSWSRTHSTVMASGSADLTVRLWDLASQTCVVTLPASHTDKVQCLDWNLSESSVLLSASFDGTARVLDARAPNAASAIFSLGSSAESAFWDPHKPTQFGVSTEENGVLFFDIRRGTKTGPIFEWKPHKKTASCICPNLWIPGLMATASLDKSIKLWDITMASADTPPQLLAQKKFDIGKIFTCAFAFDDPYLLAAGGSDSDKPLAIWHCDDQDTMLGLDGVSAGDVGIGGLPVLQKPVEYVGGTPSAAAGATAPAATGMESDSKKTRKKKR